MAERRVEDCVSGRAGWDMDRLGCFCRGGCRGGNGDGAVEAGRRGVGGSVERTNSTGAARFPVPLRNGLAGRGKRLVALRGSLPDMEACT